MSFSILEGVDSWTQPSFSLRNRTNRLFWGIVYVLLYRPTGRPLHAWRIFLLRCFGAKIGQHCRVYPNARIWAPWNLTLADYACLGEGVDCYSIAPVFIGKRAVVSQRAFICTGSHDYEDPNFQLYAKPIHIGNNAWICAEAFLGPGVTISEGAVIGARAVATKDMPAWTVCAGNPCKPLKPRVIKDKHSSDSLNLS
jgi:putative colanic acid biosynthesis acetyltransferase WcaF